MIILNLKSDYERKIWGRRRSRKNGDEILQCRTHMKKKKRLTG